MGGGLETLPKEFGYVVLVVAVSGLLHFWMSTQVGVARRRYKVALPALYASESDNKDANIYNCIQRSSENSLEWLPQFLTFILLGGIRHPVIAAVLGLFYNVSRYLYFTGYASGNPEKRLTVGKYSFLALLGLIVCTISCGVSFLI